jgi:hypothetical protein
MSASEYVFIRRITILLLNKDEAEVFEIPILVKGLALPAIVNESTSIYKVLERQW